MTRERLVGRLTQIGCCGDSVQPWEEGGGLWGGREGPGAFHALGNDSTCSKLPFRAPSARAFGCEACTKKLSKCSLRTHR
jgi:hypothetical protein